MGFCRQQISAGTGQIDQVSLSKEHLSHVLTHVDPVKKAGTWVCVSVTLCSVTLTNFYHEWRDHASNVHRNHLLPATYPNAVLELTSCLICFPPPAKHLSHLWVWMKKAWPLLFLGVGWIDTTLLSCSRKPWVSLDFYIFYWLFFLFNTLVLSLCFP